MSKSAFSIVCIAALLCLGVAPVVRADPGSNEICLILQAEFGVQLSHDACVACETVFNHDSHAGQVCFCKTLQDAGLFEELGFKNLGQCVSTTDFGASNLSVVTLSTLLMGWGAFQFFRRRRSGLNI